MKSLLIILGLGAGGTITYILLQQVRKRKLIESLALDLSDVEKQGTGQASLEKMSLSTLQEYQKALTAKKLQLINKIKSSLPSGAFGVSLSENLAKMTAQELVDVDGVITSLTGGFAQTDQSQVARLEKIVTKYGIKI